MSFGLDYVSGPSLAAMLSSGVTFVCRYLSFENDLTRGKLLTPYEADALGLAGIALVSNYEWYANRALEGESSGVEDAHIAASQHAACGGPADRPIYFSVDVDTSGQATLPYFKGVASVIGLHRTGAYGSYRVLKELFDAGAITWGWQTYAWSGGTWEPRAHIQQYANGMDMDGHAVDHNRSMKDDYGQWFSNTISPTQEEPMTPLTLANVKQHFTLNTDGSWARIDAKTGLPVLDSTGKPIVLKGAIRDDWCSHGLAVLADIGLPTGNETPVDPAHPEVTEQRFERCIRRFDPNHTLDSPPYAGHVYSEHIESLYIAGEKLSLALDSLVALQKQLDALKAGGVESAYVAAVKAVKAIVDPLAV